MFHGQARTAMVATDLEDRILLSAPKIQTLPSALEKDLDKGEMLELVFPGF